MSEVIKAVESVIAGFKNKEERYKIVDEEHLLDTHTGLKFHMYSDYFKITKVGTVVATSTDFSVADRPVFLVLKEELFRQYTPIKEAKVQKFIAAYQS